MQPRLLVFTLFGGFMMGSIMPDIAKFRMIFIEKVEDVSVVLYLCFLFLAFAVALAAWKDFKLPIFVVPLAAYLLALCKLFGSHGQLMDFAFYWLAFTEAMPLTFDHLVDTKGVDMAGRTFTSLEPCC
jgi:hypothetical protein